MRELIERIEAALASDFQGVYSPEELLRGALEMLKAVELRDRWRGTKGKELVAIVHDEVQVEI